MVKGNLTVIFWQIIDNSNDRFLATTLLHTRQVNLKMQALVKAMVMQPTPKILMKMGTKMQVLRGAM